MNITTLSIPDIILIEPQVFSDDRGFFFESFNEQKFQEATGVTANFIQDNHSQSTKGVLRGLHFQLPPYAQSKLVRVIEGSVLDVAVDIRKGSSTFGQSVAIQLSGDNKKQLFVPRGFAHGFVVLTDTATFAYKVDNYYSPECDRGLAFDDKELNIDWVLPAENLSLSDKDSKQPPLSELVDCFDYEKNYYV